MGCRNDDIISGKGEGLWIVDSPGWVVHSTHLEKITMLLGVLTFCSGRNYFTRLYSVHIHKCGHITRIKSLYVLLNDIFPEYLGILVQMYDSDIMFWALLEHKWHTVLDNSDNYSLYLVFYEAVLTTVNQVCYLQSTKISSTDRLSKAVVQQQTL